MGGEAVRSFKKRRHAMSGKCGVTSIAGLFVAVWELVLKPCQLAERPIQKKKKKKKFPCFYPQNKYPLYSTPDTHKHTHTLQTWQSVKETRVGVSGCVCMCGGDCGGSGRGYPLAQGRLPTKFKCECSCGHTTQDGCKHPV